jgi:signal transduction histidine kinase
MIRRTQLGRAILRAKRAGALVVALDVTLARPCPVGRGTPAWHDAPLIAAVKAPGETVLVADPTSNPDRVYFDEPAGYLFGDTAACIASPVLYNPRGVIRGVCTIQSGIPSSVVKRELEPLDVIAKSYPSLAMAVWAAWKGSSCELPEPVSDTAVLCAGALIPTWPQESTCLFGPLVRNAVPSKQAMLISWAGRAGTFPAYSLPFVQSASDSMLRDALGGRIVMFGSLAERRRTPMDGRGASAGWPYADQSGEMSLSGLEIHANALDTVMQGRYIRPIPQPATWALTLSVCLTTATLFFLLGTWRAAAAMLCELAILAAVARWYAGRDVWVYAVIPGVAAGVTGAVASLWAFAEARREAAGLASEVEARDAATETLVHDLKQPLATISTLAAALRAQQQMGATTATPELLTMIQGQVGKALGDIDELLNTSPGHQVALQYQAFDLVALTRDLSVTHSMRSSVHSVEVRAQAPEIVVEGDPRYLGRAISNLIDNAIKYWPEGGTVVVEVETQSDFVIVRVSDRGLGISPEQRQRIFARFQRALPEGVRIPGTGVGLYSVKRIVEAHGGVIDVVSTPGDGSTFYLTLPRRRPTAVGHER